MERRYAVAVKMGGPVIRHLPRKVSRVCSLFLRRGGHIRCAVTGRRSDLPQAGLEIPCLLLFYDNIIAEAKELAELKIVLYQCLYIIYDQQRTDHSSVQYYGNNIKF